MGDVVEFAVRSIRWNAPRQDGAYVADWRAHAGGPRAPAAALFSLRTQRSADLDTARWGVLAWEDPCTGMPASPFWFDEAMPEGRFVELDDADAPHSRAARRCRRDAEGTSFPRWRARSEDCAGRKSGQVRLPEADAADSVRCGLTMSIAVDDEFPETHGLTMAYARAEVETPQRRCHTS